MNKSELISAVAAGSGQTKSAVTTVLDVLTTIITEQVAKREEVVLFGLGTFKTKERAERAGRNPQTGEAITIKAAVVPHFAVSSTLKAVLK